MGILVVAEHDNAKLKTGTANAVPAAAKIGGDIHVLVAGEGCGAAAQPWPATRTCTSPPIFAAAVTALDVPDFSFALSCSAMTSAVISRSPSLRI